MCLNDIRNPNLREALGAGYPCKADILTLDDGKPDGFSVHLSPAARVASIPKPMARSSSAAEWTVPLGGGGV